MEPPGESMEPFHLPKREILAKLEKHRVIMEEYERGQPEKLVARQSAGRRRSTLNMSSRSSTFTSVVTASTIATTSSTISTTVSNDSNVVSGENDALVNSNGKENDIPEPIPPPPLDSLELKRHEYEWYNQQYTEMQQLLKQLHALRLEGAAFSVVPTRRLTAWRDRSQCNRGRKSAHHELEVSSVGRIAVRSLPHRHLVRLHHIDELKCVKVKTNVSNSGDAVPPARFVSVSAPSVLSPIVAAARVREEPPPCLAYDLVQLEWKNGKACLYLCQDAQELVEVIGAHLRHYNHKKYQHIAYLKKKVYPLKHQQIKLIPETVEEKEAQILGVQLLLRLWHALWPTNPFFGDNWNGNVHDLTQEQIAKVLKDQRWTFFGFQNASPATDLRGMGLLGLWFLVFMAERSIGVDHPTLCVSRVRTSSALSKESWLVRMVQDNAEHAQEVEQLLNPELFGACGPSPSEEKPPRKHQKREYPWAVAGINVCAMLVHRLLNLSDDLQPIPNSDPRWDSPLLQFLACLEPNTELQVSYHILANGDSRRPTISHPLPPEFGPGSPRTVSNMSALSASTNGKHLHDPPRHSLCVHANVEYVFEVAMEVVERVYRRTGAGYMDFPVVLRRVEQKLLEWLGQPAPSKDTKPHRSLATAQRQLLAASLAAPQEDRPLSLCELWAKVNDTYAPMREHEPF